MHYFRFLATPKGSHPESRDIGGANIECWIREPVQGAAKMIAIGVIEQRHWRIESLEETREIEREDLTGDERAARCFDEAELDGMSFVFDAWPAGALGREDE